MIGSVLIFLGICSVIISSVGVIRFPDFYTRLHAAGITDSSGATLLLIGFALQNGFSINTVKIILLILIIWVASSTNGYILARTYYKVKKKTVKEG
ncbi:MULTISPECIES: monovalent cation/H(+) antiporter subunit G [Rickettsiales]|jgi:multicomponent Na+:H+ antiporter subunit G|uniref:Cation:proton antiporter n=1 Tax=Wolbachia pipientis TaxID=955 RepID=A0A6H2NVM0_WOLPI|nr:MULTISPECIES: monovalent cation/H(+) antiporter subunit G [Rickettsiales]MBV2146021.1 monovalent cation/H(+) antiporter subunit G [Wolbachia endosymbiont of Pissodes strobi]MDR2046267.1 monovalent cation/H(+) antiporter subunit G [Rickettsiales bacterium]MDX5495475.1 monovalent cation/H(+) antiporter subunit G [Wolbachia endosymbiont of Nomada marshamella]MBC6686336.1 monovalent cation/H(+) antiporter subunit G [Wolbachia pipientis]MDE5061438.1 monovalent cation/H(+) antiporter subunit G [W